MWLMQIRFYESDEIISDLDGCGQLVAPGLYSNLVRAKHVEIHGVTKCGFTGQTHFTGS